METFNAEGLSMSPTKTADIQPVAFPATELPARLGNPGLTRATISKAKKQGKWPRLIRIAGRDYCTFAEFDRFLTERQAQADTEIDQECRRQHAVKAVAARRDRKAAASEPAP